VLGDGETMFLGNLGRRKIARVAHDLDEPRGA
jgi:hypothetical protein